MANLDDVMEAGPLATVHGGNLSLLLLMICLSGQGG